MPPLIGRSKGPMNNALPPKLKKFPAAKQRRLDELLNKKQRRDHHTERENAVGTARGRGRATDGCKRAVAGGVHGGRRRGRASRRGGCDSLGEAGTCRAIAHGTRGIVPPVGRGPRRRRCEYCRLLELATGVTFHIEHIVPRRSGGRTRLSNLALSCPGCNLAKSGKTAGVDSHGAVQPLFNPHNYEPWLLGWHLHFILDRRTGIIVPRSPMGDATILTLQVNAPQRVFARKLQIRAGLIA